MAEDDTSATSWFVLQPRLAQITKKPAAQKAEPILYTRMQIVLKELRESLYWLRLADRAGLISTQDLKPLISEAEGLAKIVGKSVVTAKSKAR